MKTSTWWMVGGSVSLAGGVLALFFPVNATVVAEQVAAVFFVVASLFQLASVPTYPHAGSKVWAALWGVLELALGLYLAILPAAGILSLTLAAGILILGSGVSRAVLAWGLPPGMRGMTLFSGLVSIVLGVMVLGQYPLTATFFLGIYLGIELISNGIGLMTGSRALRWMESR